MRIVIYYGGNTKGKDEDQDLLIELLEFTEIEMERVPQVGERLCLYLDHYRVYADVTNVYPSYSPQGFPFIKKRAWGESCAIQLDNAEIDEDLLPSSMMKYDDGVWLTNEEAAKIREILRLVASMHDNPGDDFLGYDFPDECKDSSELYQEMRKKGIGLSNS